MIMTFFANFKRSAKELGNIRSLAVTAILIALDLVLKAFVTIRFPAPIGKISVAFLALAAIGMLYGPVVSSLAAAITDILGLVVSQEISAFNPMYTLVEVTAGFLYGLFLYNITVVKPDFSGGKAFFKSIVSNWSSFLRIVAAKLLVILICNIFMTNLAHVITGYIAPDTFMATLSISIGKNFIKMPFDIILMLLTMYPINAAYKKVFKKNLSPAKQ